MLVRPYESEDFDQVTNLYKVPSLYGGNFDENRDTKKRLQQASDQNDLYVAVDVVGLVVGSIMLLDNAHSFWIMRFAVDDRHPEHEAASNRLLSMANKVARLRGHDSIIAYSSPKYDDLDKRYKTLKFNEANIYKCYWKEVK